MSQIGRSAPDFELADQHGAPWRLSAQRGHGVVLVFYPFAFTGVCTGELCALRDEVVPAMPEGTRLVAISCDSTFSLRVFGEQQQIAYPLLSDHWPHGAVASSYGVFDDEIGCAQRGSFLVDADGIIRWSVVNAIPDARDVDDYRRALAGLSVARD